METISEGLEAFGGQGAMEDTGLPVLLRDSQIFVIWEGTTNILSWDVLRAMSKTNGESLKALRSNIRRRLELASTHTLLKEQALKVQTSMDEVVKTVEQNNHLLEAGARDLAFTLARLFIAATLLETSCSHGSTALDETTALRSALLSSMSLFSCDLRFRWCQSQDLTPFLRNFSLNYYNKSNIETNYKLVMESYDK